MAMQDTTVTGFAEGKGFMICEVAANRSGMSRLALIVVYCATRLVMVLEFSLTARSWVRPWVTSKVPR